MAHSPNRGKRPPKDGSRSPTGHRTLAQMRAHSTKNLSPADKAKNKRRVTDRRKAVKAGIVSRNSGIDLDHSKPNARGGVTPKPPSVNRSLRGRRNGRTRQR